MADEMREKAQAYHAELRAAANANPNDPLPVYAWQLRGLTGAGNLIEGMARNGVRFHNFWVSYLETEAQRLTDLAKQIRDRNLVDG